LGPRRVHFLTSSGPVRWRASMGRVFSNCVISVLMISLPGVLLTSARLLEAAPVKDSLADANKISKGLEIKISLI
jgi:hypothetical protein